MVSENTLAINAAVTIVINLISVGGQHILNKRNRKDERVENWKLRLRSTSRELKREAMKMNPNAKFSESNFAHSSEEGVENLISTYKEIEKLHDERPKSIAGSELDESVGELVSWFQSPQYTGNEFTGIEVTENVVDKSQNILSKLD